MVDLSSYIFKIIDYDPTEKPRGVITADEWNTIMSLLLEACNYASSSLQEIVADLYTASQLSSTALGEDGSRLIGVETIPGITGDNVNAVLRDLKRQIDDTVLGSVPDGSIDSSKLAPNLNFKGDSVKFNGTDLLTTGHITKTVDNQSTDLQIPSAKTIYNLLLSKQDNIAIGTTVPGSTTPGYIYLQYAG